MLVVKLKPDDELEPYVTEKKIFVLECFGCQDVYFPHNEVDKFIGNLNEKVIERVRMDYMCNRDFVSAYIEKYSEQIQEAEISLVCSCGVGAQIMASLMESKVVYTCCDTLYINGFQGLSVQQFDCYQCGECYLNYTGAVCPLTNCPKGLINGPCGGEKEGKCEVNHEADCAWGVIYKRLKKLNKLGILEKILIPRDYSNVLTQSLSREKIER